MKKLKKVIGIVSLASFLVLSMSVSVLAAAIPSDIGEGLPEVDTDSSFDTPSEVYNSIMTVFEWVYGIILAVAIIVIVWGGLKYLTAGGDEAQAGAARQLLTKGVIALVIILGVVLLVKLVASFLGVTAPTIPF